MKEPEAVENNHLSNSLLSVILFTSEIMTKVVKSSANSCRETGNLAQRSTIYHLFSYVPLKYHNPKTGEDKTTIT